jgi:hypothetical protein
VLQFFFDEMKYLYNKNKINGWTLVAHACNPSYPGELVQS